MLLAFLSLHQISLAWQRTLFFQFCTGVQGTLSSMRGISPSIRPQHQELPALLFAIKCVGSFTSHRVCGHRSVVRLDLRFITLIARRLESPAICRCRYKGGTFSSRLLKTLSEPTTSHTLFDAQPAKLPVGGSSLIACRQKCQNKLLGYAGNQPI